MNSDCSKSFPDQTSKERMEGKNKVIYFLQLAVRHFVHLFRLTFSVTFSYDSLFK